jgi:hypothetical protein
MSTLTGYNLMVQPSLSRLQVVRPRPPVRGISCRPLKLGHHVITRTDDSGAWEVGTMCVTLILWTCPEPLGTIPTRSRKTLRAYTRPTEALSTYALRPHRGGNSRAAEGESLDGDPPPRRFSERVEKSPFFDSERTREHASVAYALQRSIFCSASGRLDDAVWSSKILGNGARSPRRWHMGEHLS